MSTLHPYNIYRRQSFMAAGEKIQEKLIKSAQVSDWMRQMRGIN